MIEDYLLMPLAAVGSEAIFFRCRLTDFPLSLKVESPDPFKLKGVAADSSFYTAGLPLAGDLGD